MKTFRILFLKSIHTFTLRKRILLISLLFSVASASIIGTITYYTISSILENKLQAAIKSNLSQVTLAMEDAISNLNHVSELFTEQGSVGQELTAYNNANTAYDRVTAMNDIASGMNLITFTNPSIGMCAFFPVDNELGYISNSRFKDTLPPQGLPLLAQYYLISYYGPHVSRDRMSNQIVLSAIRKLNYPGSPDIYVYIETGFNLTQQILANDMVSEGISHLMIDNNGKVVYSENKSFAVGSTLDVSAADSGEAAGYRWYKATSNQGWSMVSLISYADYNREKNRWLNQYFGFVVLFLLFSLFCGFLLWRTVYRPLRRFNEDIKAIERGDLDTPPERIGIPEYDHIVDSLKSMKAQIKELILEVGRKEKLRADLEIEKLRLQINPHFLMNTLNTAHWLAITKNEPEIDKVIQSLNRLLSYNLGKSGSTATLRDELAVLDDYMRLQQVRHDIRFTVVNNVGEDALDVSLPRFILQPIIENSIRHGIGENPRIGIEISIENSRLLISVSDNGPGMGQDSAERMLRGEEVQDLPRMGIGISYVKRTLESHYGEAADLEVRSEMGKGVTFMLYIPFGEGGH